MKLILASPTYGPIDPSAARSLRAAVMHASKYGHTWIGDASPDKEAFAHARNHVVKDVLEAEDSNPEQYKDAAVMWVDSDIILPVDAITTLAFRGYDFITGVYFQRGEHHWPLVAYFNGKSFQWIVQWTPQTIVPADGCGFGCVLTSLKMLRAMKQPAFEYVKFSEDFDFCLKAKAAGYQLYCDTSVLCGHLDNAPPVTIEDYKKAHPEFFGGQANDTVGSDNAARNVVISEDWNKDQGGASLLGSSAA